MQSLTLHKSYLTYPKQRFHCTKKESQNLHYFGIKTYRQIKISPKITYLVYALPPLQCKPFALQPKIPRFTLVRPPNPYRLFKAHKQLKQYAILGIGANCGECLITFWKLFKRFKKKNVIISLSSILKNPAFGWEAQADFYNAILWVKTKLGYVEFWSFCAYLERIFGRNRKRPFKNAPRTLDIDIIGFKNQFLRFKHLQIPHIAWSLRESVRIPLLERKV